MVFVKDCLKSGFNSVKKDEDWKLGGEALRRVLRFIASYACLNQMSAVS